MTPVVFPRLALGLPHVEALDISPDSLDLKLLCHQISATRRLEFAYCRQMLPGFPGPVECQVRGRLVAILGGQRPQSRLVCLWAAAPGPAGQCEIDVALVACCSRLKKVVLDVVHHGFCVNVLCKSLLHESVSAAVTFTDGCISRS